ncbi:peptidase family S66 [Microdochium bolleyi]|uniref:Peptidase family S66 n=1 Tax=Microdochium bolleyi TaxID=196109 RepID=A0A136ISU0_9PEZI|nr:peptidase family S66 [Microdochium bolleyi]
MPPSPITPKALEPGSIIAVISPSLRLNHIYPSVIARGIALLAARGYTVREIYHGESDDSIQSSIRNRLSELREALTDPTISAVICTIGGTTFTELIPALVADADLHAAVRANPKIIVGYSDITGLHWLLHALTGLRTFYGPCILPELGQAVIPTPDLPGAEAANSPVAFCAENLFRVITPLGRSDEPLAIFPRSRYYHPGGDAFWKHGDSHAHVPPRSLAPNTFGWEWIRGGRATGRLFGGCLTVMARLGGIRAIAPDWEGRIVFLETATGDSSDNDDDDEDVKGNPLPRVQAALADLIAQGVFDKAAGLVVGRPVGYDSAQDRGEYKRVIRELLCEGGPLVDDDQRREFPILFGVDFGHTTPMVTLPYDVTAVLDSERDLFGLLEPTVL